MLNPFSLTKNSTSKPKDDLEEIASATELDIRMVHALAGDRSLTAREQNVVDRLMQERKEGFYSDLLYALTHKPFPSRQSRHLWLEVLKHRQHLKEVLGRDVGLTMATHDYLVNVTGQMRNVCVVEEAKLNSLTNVATKDGLTKLFDQATFKHKLREEMERQTRYSGTLSLVMLDIDFFKKINDGFGHAEGDAVLREFADVIRSAGRGPDTVARYGGEEFAVILPEVPLKSAYIFAERLRQTIENHFAGREYTVTSSMGIAECPKDQEFSGEDLIKSADKKLYEAKQTGRNRVCY